MKKSPFGFHMEMSGIAYDLNIHQKIYRKINARIQPLNKRCQFGYYTEDIDNQYIIAIEPPGCTHNYNKCDCAACRRYRCAE